MRPLLPVDIEKFNNLREEFYTIENDIVHRIGAVVDEVSKACGFSYSTWTTTDCSDQYCSAWILLPTGRSYIDISKIKFHHLQKYIDCVEFLTLEGKRYNIFEKLPRRWLTESFSKELYAARQAEYDKFKNTERLVKRAMAKLTDAEVKLLGL
jgi:hypothetical protein